MTKTILIQSKDAIEKGLHPYERKAWLLNLLMQRMSEAGYPVETPAQVEEILTTGAERYIRSRIVNSAPLSIGTIKLSKEALMDVVELPDMTEILSTEKVLKQYHTVRLDSLSFDGKAFKVSQDTTDTIVSIHTQYAETQRQIDAVNEAKKVCAAVQAFRKKFGPQHMNECAYSHFVKPEQYLIWDPFTLEFSVDVRHIMRNLK